MNILNNNLISTVTGTIAGGGLVLLFDYYRKNKENIQENFNASISIQLALQQILNVLLYMCIDHNNCQAYTLNLYRQLDYQDINKMWAKFRHVELRKFYNTYLYIDFNWNFQQFLSDKTGSKRDLLYHLISARAIYQHINSLLEIRKLLFDKASELISNYKIINPQLADKMYENENLLNILPMKLHVELASVTDEYVRSLPNSIRAVHNAFNQISEYIKNKFSNSQPLKLNIPDELRNLFDEIIHS